MARLKRLEKNEGDPKSQEMMADLEGKKMLLNIFRGLANSPAALDAYFKLSGAVKSASIGPKISEAIALAVGQANNCGYCLAAHSTIGKGAGLDEASILDARRGKSNDPKTAAAVKLALRIVETRGGVSDADLSAARSAGLDDGAIAEIVTVVALNLLTNYFNNLNQTDIDFPKVPALT